MKWIHLSNGDRAIVDDDDYPIVSQYNWHCRSRSKERTKYAFRHVGSTQQYMHTLITGFSKTDHKNGNGLDNRKENLRETTNSKNKMNVPKQRGNYTSKYKGVCMPKNYTKWRATIYLNRRAKHLGYFENEIDAARAYDKAAREMFGDLALTNFED